MIFQVYALLNSEKLNCLEVYSFQTNSQIGLNKKDMVNYTVSFRLIHRFLLQAFFIGEADKSKRCFRKKLF